RWALTWLPARAGRRRFRGRIDRRAELPAARPRAPVDSPVGGRVPARRAGDRLRPPHLRRGGPPAVARLRPARPARRRERAALRAAPGRADAARVTRPRRGARLDDGPAA